MKVDLSKYDNSWYEPGKNAIIRATWFILNAVVIKNPIVAHSSFKVWLLRLFGAKIGKGAVIKPSVNVKYPWNLEIGDSTWIGEGVWLDSIEKIRIGSNVCISQAAYLCTGNHDWSDCSFGLVIKPIRIEEGAWIGARSNVMPGVVVANHSIISAGSTITKSTEPYGIYVGNPAIKVKNRFLKKSSARRPS